MEASLEGLSSREVEARVAAGEVNSAQRALTRTIPRIFRDNLFTFFNLLILILFVLMMTAGQYKNGLFFLVAVANIIIGTAQEVRSKLTIDRLAVITQTHVSVVRDGVECAVRQEEIVLGDTVLLALGSQVCADGELLAAQGLEVDESLLTGESVPIKKQPGAAVFSGSYVVAGSGAFRVTAVGASSYAQQISAQAKYEKKSNSQLMRTISLIIKALTFALVPLGVALFLRTFLVAFDYPTALLSATAAAVGMIPAGLILLTSVAFAVGAFNLVRHRTLTQSMPSIETLARVNVLCLDKTGTITDGTLSVCDVVVLSGELGEVEAGSGGRGEVDAGGAGVAGGVAEVEAGPGRLAEVEEALAELVHALPRDNETAEALGRRFALKGGDGIGSATVAGGAAGRWQVERTLAFSSARKLSACTFVLQGAGEKSDTDTATGSSATARTAGGAAQAASGGAAGSAPATHRTYVLGAPEFVLPEMPDELRALVAAQAALGLRVLLLAQSDVPLAADADDAGANGTGANDADAGTDADGLPSALTQSLSPQALILLADHVRESAPATFAFFEEQGVDIKVISGDDPQTVSTIAGLAGIAGSGDFVDMSRVPATATLDDLKGLMEANTVFGRTSPDQKREMVRALKASKNVVGMTGDGVNDAMALREADVGIAMASGSDATRAAADFVLIDSDFAAMVQVVREGRRVVNNIEGVASLFIIKTLYSVALTLLFIIISLAYPFQPIQLTLLGFFMIGAPSFFLTFEPNYKPMHDRFLSQLVQGAVPAAVLVVLNVAAIEVIGVWLGLALVEVSTLCVLMNGVVCLCLLVRVCRPFTKIKLAMVIVLGLGFFICFIFFAGFFELTSIFNSLAWIWVPLVVVTPVLYQVLTRAVLRVQRSWGARGSSEQEGSAKRG